MCDICEWEANHPGATWPPKETREPEFGPPINVGDILAVQIAKPRMISDDYSKFGELRYELRDAADARVLAELLYGPMDGDPNMPAPLGILSTIPTEED